MSKPIFFTKSITWGYWANTRLQNIKKWFWDVPNRRSVERPMGTSFLFVCSSYLYQLFVLCFLLLCFLQSPRNTLSKTQQPSHVNAINTFERLYQLLTAFNNFRHRHHRLQIKKQVTLRPRVVSFKSQRHGVSWFLTRQGNDWTWVK